MVSCPNIEKEQEPTCDEPDKLINLPPSKSSGGCVARCMCDVWAVQEEGDYKKDPDDRRTIFFGQFCIPYEGCPIDDDPDVALCDLAKKIDLQSPDLPVSERSWCNTDPLRRASKGECHQHFFSTKTGENYACEWRPDEGRGSKCKSVLCEATMAK